MKLIFAGTPPVAAKVLRELAKTHEIALVITRPDAEVGRKRQLTQSEVAMAAHELGIQVLKSAKFSKDDLKTIQDVHADLAIVVAFGVLLPREALEILPWWNMHFSLLPQWRGATPLQHSLIHQTGQGVTLFQIETGLDTGPIVSQKELDLPADKSAGELLDELSTVGLDLIEQALSEPTEPKPQIGTPTLAPKIARAEAKLDFERTAMELQRQTFALNPEPMAWCKTNRGDLRVLKSRALGGVDWGSVSRDQLAPGQIEESGSRVLVACGNGTRLELLEVQPAGGKAMSAADWYRGFGGASLE